MVILGDEVQDTVTGFVGIAVAEHSCLQGCTRITVQPRVSKDGTIPSEKTFDEPQLKVVKKQKVKRVAIHRDPGGPEKFSPQHKSAPAR